ncbi:MAG: heavy-metal-associated domain-containing protein [Planctomycetes bacterium]|nr:heavy-metal-associated domain-containing protein [Planctomycetota bacterium]
MHNAQRSVERVEGVKSVVIDLNTGRGAVTFEPGQAVSPAKIWKAIEDSGFTPVRIEIGGEVYRGSDP